MVGVVALLMSNSERAAADLIAHGADRVLVCPCESEEYEGEVWVREAAAVARELNPAAVLAAHTPAGADLAPRLAFRLESGVATGCVALSIEGDRVVCSRPCYGGNAREALSFAAGSAIVTVRSGVGTPQSDRSRTAEVVMLAAPKPATRVRVIARELEATAGTRLEDAKIVVAGGRGLEGPEGFKVIEALADELGAVVGSSRVPCDLGWVPHSKQIGLTGKTVTPDLYFAVGISGAGHHMAGCGNARAIVAINTDPDAAIFREAKFGVVGDYRKVVPALAQAISELKNTR
jgi:electron transfer flavoprotein alpha subunit